METVSISISFFSSIPASSTSRFAFWKIAISSGELRSATFIRLRYADAISGTSTSISLSTLLQQDNLHPCAYSSSDICLVLGESRVPFSNFTLHFPQDPLPEQGASIATFVFLATSRRFSSSAAYPSTASPFSKRNVTLYMT